MSGATEESNEKHLAPWAEACSRDGISNTPLSPYLDQELLYNKHLHVDGSKIESTGFNYRQATPTLDLMRKVRHGMAWHGMAWHSNKYYNVGGRRLC